MLRKTPFYLSTMVAKVVRSSVKVMLSCFLGCEDIIMNDNLENRQTISGNYNLGLLIKLRSELDTKKACRNSVIGSSTGNNTQFRQKDSASLKSCHSQFNKLSPLRLFFFLFITKMAPLKLLKIG